MTGIVKNGKFIADDFEGFKEEYAKFEGLRVIVTVGKETKKRSKKQNNYYFGIIVKEFSSVTGYTSEEAHEILKFQFLKEMKVNKETGLMMEYSRSTAGLTTTEYEEYLEQCRIFLNINFGCNVPLPNEIL
jgi:hypothetical protein